MESSRTSLASKTSLRTHFEVLGFEASSPRKLPCLRLEDSTIFWTVEILLENARNLAEKIAKTFFCFPQVEITWKKILKTFFWRTLRLFPRSLASEFFCVLGLGLEPRVFDSTSGSKLIRNSYSDTAATELQPCGHSFAQTLDDSDHPHKSIVGNSKT